MSCSSGGRNAGLQFLLVVVWYHETSGGETRPLKSTMLASGTIKTHALLNQNQAYECACKVHKSKNLLYVKTMLVFFCLVLQQLSPWWCQGTPRVQMWGVRTSIKTFLTVSWSWERVWTTTRRTWPAKREWQPCAGDNDRSAWCELLGWPFRLTQTKFNPEGGENWDLTLHTTVWQY